MEQNMLWQAFASTGDPVLYLWYKAMQGNGKGIEKEVFHAGALPREES